MAKVHELFLHKYFEEHSDAVLMGTDLVKILKEEYHELSEINCRKIISNAVKKALIKNSGSMMFENNQYAYFSNKRSADYDTLREVIKEHKKYLHRAIFALQRNGGWLSLLELVKVTGAVLREDAHSVSIKRVKRELESLHMGESVVWGNSEFIYNSMDRPESGEMDRWLRAMEEHNLLAYLIAGWMVQTNLMDGRMACFAGEKNQYLGAERNGELWDIFGFTNAVGLGVKQKEFQTIVVADLGVYERYEEYDFTGFKARVDRLIHSVHGEKRKVLPIIFFRELSPRVQQLLIKNGYLNFSLDIILGRNFRRVIKRYNENIDVLQKKLNTGQTDVQSGIEECLREIRQSGSEDNYGNLKGHLFEYLMFPVLQKVYPERDVRFFHGYSGSVNQEKFECDYLIDTPTENVIVELKGYGKKNIIRLGTFQEEQGKPEPNTVKWFLTRTFKLCREFYGGKKPYKFSYITTAVFEPAAVDRMIARKKEKPEKIECYYDYPRLLELLEKLGMESEKEIIEQFYS